jgi:hypothetical protein
MSKKAPLTKTVFNRDGEPEISLLFSTSPVIDVIAIARFMLFEFKLTSM